MVNITDSEESEESSGSNELPEPEASATGESDVQKEVIEAANEAVQEDVEDDRPGEGDRWETSTSESDPAEESPTGQGPDEDDGLGTVAMLALAGVAYFVWTRVLGNGGNQQNVPGV